MKSRRIQEEVRSRGVSPSEGGCEDHIMAYVGKAEGDIGSRSIMYTLARATCMAVNLAITPMNEFFVDDVTLVPIGQTDAVNVLVGLVGAGINSERLLKGAALVRRSIEEACVRATLDAVNRRCEVIMEMIREADKSVRDLLFRRWTRLR